MISLSISFMQKYDKFPFNIPVSFGKTVGVRIFIQHIRHTHDNPSAHGFVGEKKFRSLERALFVLKTGGHNRINVLGAVNAITKEVTTFINTTYITAETVMDFLRLLKEKYSDKSVFWYCIMPNINIAGQLWKKSENLVLPYYFYRLTFRTLISWKDFGSLQKTNFICQIL
jgi:hypothetical protein